jgi:uncharacterized protein YbjT (DUF2867 family)
MSGTPSSKSTHERRSTTVEDVASRFRTAIGLPRALATRLSKKLNVLAQEVDWASPLPEAKTKTHAVARARARAYGRSMKARKKKK